MDIMEKYERDGNVAILISIGYGAGWSTWGPWVNRSLAYDKRIVEAFISGISKEDMSEFLETLGYHDVYMGGFDNLEIEWVPKGTLFRIEEYDGHESIEVFDEKSYIVA